MDWDHWLPWLARAVGAGVALAYGQIDPAIWVLVATMGLDIASGILAGGKAGELNSSVSFRGMRKKAMLLILVAMGAVLQTQAPHDVPLASLIAGALIVSETLSVIENAGRLGVPIPGVLTQAIQQLSGKGKSEE